MGWNTVWTGKMWLAEQSVQPDGRVFERVLRAPGSRILVVHDGKLLLNREKRTELGGALDYRLPGGKVFDTNSEYQSYLKTGQAIVDASRASITKEALEEVGLIIDPSALVYLGADVLGATAAWDLHYWLATDFKTHEQGAQFHETEADEIVGSEWVDFKDLEKLVLATKTFSESRSAAAILRYIKSL